MDEQLRRRHGRFQLFVLDCLLLWSVSKWRQRSRSKTRQSPLITVPTRLTARDRVDEGFLLFLFNANRSNPSESCCCCQKGINGILASSRKSGAVDFPARVCGSGELPLWSRYQSRNTFWCRGFKDNMKGELASDLRFGALLTGSCRRFPRQKWQIEHGSESDRRWAGVGYEYRLRVVDQYSITRISSQETTTIIPWILSSTTPTIQYVNRKLKMALVGAKGTANQIFIAAGYHLPEINQRALYIQKKEYTLASCAARTSKVLCKIECVEFGGSNTAPLAFTDQQPMMVRMAEHIILECCSD